MSEHELVRALEAERLRPVPPRPPRRMPGIDRAALEELLDEVARPTAHQRAAAGRFEDYAFLRDLDEPLEAAAARVGIRPKTARSYYEPAYRRGEPSYRRKRGIHDESR